MTAAERAVTRDRIAAPAPPEAVERTQVPDPASGLRSLGGGRIGSPAPDARFDFASLRIEPARPAASQPATRTQKPGETDARWDEWHDWFEASSEQARPGEDRALALRALRLFEHGPDAPFAARDDVDRFADLCRKRAADEDDTLRVLATGTSERAVLVEDGAAFPRHWERIAGGLHSGADPQGLFRALQAAEQGARGIAHELSGEIGSRGLPLSRVEAAQAAADTLVPRAMRIARTKSSSDELTVRYARAVLRWDLATYHYFLVQFYDSTLDHRIEHIHSGDLVMNQDEYRTLVTEHQALVYWLGRFRTAQTERGIDATIATLLLRAPDRFYRITGGTGYEFRWSREAIAAFQDAIDRVDRDLAAASPVARIWRAATWATERGYYTAEALAAWQALRDNPLGAAQGIATLVGIALLQAIPGVDVAVDLVLMIEFGADILITAKDLGEVLIAAGRAGTVVELEHATAQLALALVGDAIKLVMFAATAGVLKGGQKLLRWRRGRKFVESNSATPEDATAARKALADARGDVDRAEKLLAQRQEHARQQRELARAEQERLKAEQERKARETEQREQARRQAEQEDAARQQKDRLDLRSQMELKNQKLIDEGQPPRYPDLDASVEAGMANLAAARQRGFPYGFKDKAAFEAASSQLKGEIAALRPPAGGRPIPTNKIAVQGSAVHRPTAKDVDIAVRVTPDEFNQLLEQSFPKQVAAVRARGIDPFKMTEAQGLTASERTLGYAVESGKLNRGSVKPSMSDARKRLAAAIGTDVDLSVIRLGGSFDRGPYFPLP